MICDFGVAKQIVIDDGEITAVDLTSTGGMIGSPMYMSPEQSRNARNVDHRSDVWRLAISLYEAVSGRKAWAGCSSVGEIIRAVCTQDAPPLREAAPWLPEASCAVVHTGLEREPSARYASVEELAAALEPFAMPTPVTRAALVAVPRAPDGRSRSRRGRSWSPSDRRRRRRSHTRSEAGSLRSSFDRCLLRRRASRLRWAGDRARRSAWRSPSRRSPSRAEERSR